MLINSYIFGSKDPYFSNVVLLLHGNGSNGSTVITDSSLTLQTVTAVGDAKISTTQSKYGGSSIVFDGNGDRLTLGSPVPTDLRLGGGDFTIEFWVYTNGSNPYAIIGNLDDGTGTGHYWVVLNSTYLGLHTIQFGTQGTAGRFGAAALTSSQWHHIALSKNGTSLRCFLNGTQLGTTATFPDLVASYTVPFYIGASYLNAPPSPPSYQLNGYIDDLRVTKGIGRYTSSFTVPDAAFPDS